MNIVGKSLQTRKRITTPLKQTVPIRAKKRTAPFPKRTVPYTKQTVPCKKKNEQDNVCKTRPKTAKQTYRTVQLVCNFHIRLFDCRSMNTKGDFRTPGRFNILLDFY